MYQATDNLTRLETAEEVAELLENMEDVAFVEPFLNEEPVVDEIQPGELEAYSFQKTEESTESSESESFDQPLPPPSQFSGVSHYFLGGTADRPELFFADGAGKDLSFRDEIQPQYVDRLDKIARILWEQRSNPDATVLPDSLRLEVQLKDGSYISEFQFGEDGQPSSFDSYQPFEPELERSAQTIAKRESPSETDERPAPTFSTDEIGYSPQPIQTERVTEEAKSIFDEQPLLPIPLASEPTQELVNSSENPTPEEHIPESLKSICSERVEEYSLSDIEQVQLPISREKPAEEPLASAEILFEQDHNLEYTFLESVTYPEQDFSLTTADAEVSLVDGATGDEGILFSRRIRGSIGPDRESNHSGLTQHESIPAELSSDGDNNPSHTLGKESILHDRAIGSIEEVEQARTGATKSEESRVLEASVWKLSSIAPLPALPFRTESVAIKSSPGSGSAISIQQEANERQTLVNHAPERRFLGGQSAAHASEFHPYLPFEPGDQSFTPQPNLPAEAPARLPEQSARTETLHLAEDDQRSSETGARSLDQRQNRSSVTVEARNVEAHQTTGENSLDKYHVNEINNTNRLDNEMATNIGQLELGNHLEQVASTEALSVSETIVESGHDDSSEVSEERANAPLLVKEFISSFAREFGGPDLKLDEKLEPEEATVSVSLLEDIEQEVDQSRSNADDGAVESSTPAVRDSASGYRTATQKKVQHVGA